MTRLGLALTLATMLAACGGDGSVALADYGSAFHDAYCHYLVKCGEYGNYDTCHASNIHISIHVDASSLAAVDMGKIDYDGGKASACFDSFASQSCDQTSESARVGSSDCESIAAGTVHAGGACALNGECISTSCNVPTCPDACCQGTCVGDTAPPVRVAIGASCASARCVSGAYCDTSGTASVCVALKSAGTACAGSGECAYGLGCTGQTTQVCAALPALGEACPVGVCRDIGTRCVASTCVAVATEGEACSTSIPCGELFTCDATQHCSIGIATGQVCTGGGGCSADGAFCDSTGVCSLPKALGAACTGNSQCDSYSCDTTSNTCVAQQVCI